VNREDVKKLITEIDLKWGRLGDTNEYFWETPEEK